MEARHEGTERRGCDLQSHLEAETSIKELQLAGFDMRKLSIVGKDFHPEVSRELASIT